MTNLMRLETLSLIVATARRQRQYRVSYYDRKLSLCAKNAIMNLLTQATNTHEVFLFPDPKWAAGIRKWLRAVDCVNNQPSIFYGDKI